MMRRVFLVVAVFSVVLVAVAGAASASSSLTATFTIHFPQGHPASNAPCAPDTFCGVGTVAGYGAATITILDETFDEIAGSPCFAVTRVEEIDLLATPGSLFLESTGTFCRPGGSGDSNAGSSSYGSPGRWDLAFTVVGAQSTGAFYGASGEGAETMGANGGVGVWHLDSAADPGN